MKAVIGSEYNERPLLSYLRGELKISGRLLTRLKRTERGITVNGEHVTVRYIIHTGDLLELADSDTEKSETVIPVDIPIDILFENDDIAVVNKPPHMPTHPSHGHIDDTLANALAYRYSDRPFVFRPINRLDRDTSGVVLIAKNQHAASFLSNEMKKGAFQKTYLAIVDGEIKASAKVEKPIRRCNGSIITRTVCTPDDEGAQYALTEYTPLAANNGRTVLAVTPKTGRTHQIRVHLASLGAPICGDDLYGKPCDHIDRQALHAYSLEFPLPSGGFIRVVAPPPKDILQLANILGINTEKGTKV